MAATIAPSPSCGIATRLGPALAFLSAAAAGPAVAVPLPGPVVLKLAPPRVGWLGLQFFSPLEQLPLAAAGPLIVLPGLQPLAPAAHFTITSVPGLQLLEPVLHGVTSVESALQVPLPSTHI